MKFAVVTDIHFGDTNPNYNTKRNGVLSTSASKLIDTFIDKMNTIVHPSFVIVLGDIICDSQEKKTDVANLLSIKSQLSKLNSPIFYLAGNHDLRNISEEKFATIFGYENLYYSFDADNYHFIALGFKVIKNDTITGQEVVILPDKQLQWLTSALSKTNKPTIVFSHFGILKTDFTKNYWFKKHPEAAIYKNSHQIQKILERSGKVMSVINGHQHWNKLEKHNNIVYISICSLVENINNAPSETFGVVELDNNLLTYELGGKNPSKNTINIGFSLSV